MDVELLATGDELLTGQVTDTNSVWLMDRLWDLGVMVRRKTLVGDDRADLDRAIRETTGRADLVVLSGGMGPTEDDLTSEVVAGVLGVPLERHAPTVTTLEERFRSFGRALTPNNLKQADFPRGAEVIPNRFGSAPGFAARLGKGEIVCLPGVPVEYRGLCEEWVLPRVAARLGAAPAARVVKLIGVPESHADHAMRPIMDDPANAGVRWGYRAHWPEVHVKWTVAGPDAASHADRIELAVRAAFGEHVWGVGKEELPAVVVDWLAARGEKVALAESCTGGLLTSLLTAVPGASAVLDLGVVAYANVMKERVLGVHAELLAAHGAVSEPVARALAEGVRRLGAATYGIGITGVAGPSGGTPEKPVGTVHIAVAGPGGTAAVAKAFRGDRTRIQRSAAYEALDLLRRALK